MVVFLAGVAVGKYIYCSNWRANGLYKINTETGESELLNVFLKERNTSMLHEYAVMYEGVIWFIPCKAERIVCYDIVKNSIEYLELPSEGKVILNGDGNCTFRFACYQMKNTEVCWLVPIGYNLMLKLDMKQKSLKCISGWPSEIKWQDGTINFYSGFLKEKYIYMCPYESTVGVKINTENETIQAWGRNMANKKYRLMIPCENRSICIALPMKNSFSIFDNETEMEEVVEVSEVDFEDEMFLTYDVGDNEVILFPFKGDKEIHIRKNDMQAYAVPVCSVQESAKENYFFQRCLRDATGTLFLTSDRENKMFKVYVDGKREFLELTVDKKQFLDVLLTLMDNNRYEPCFQDYKFDEGFQEENMGLSNYIKYIKCVKMENEEESSEEKVGERIHEMCSIVF